MSGRAAVAWVSCGLGLRGLARQAGISVIALGFGLGMSAFWQPIVQVSAFNCSPGSFTSQQNKWNGSGHGWLGICDNNWAAQTKYYTGEDWVGTTLSGQQVHLRAWSCGNLYYDQTY